MNASDSERGYYSEVVTLPETNEYRLYPGGYLGCLSAIRGRSFMHGDYLIRCQEPRGHDGKHRQYLHNGRREWSDEPASSDTGATK